MSPDPVRPRPPWVTVAWLVALAALVAAAIAMTSFATRERSERNASAQVMKILRPMLPPGGYDNEPEQDRIFITAPELGGAGEPLPVYRARHKGKPVAAVLTVVARQGYVGPIRLLVSLGANGSVIAVRALTHQETPGLGDRIEPRNSDWMESFNGRSLADLPPGSWAVRRDGGEFDQLTGATITSRAVVNAVRDAALYFRQHQAGIFGRDPE